MTVQKPYVSDEYFRTVMTNTGLSVGQLSASHKVMLVFIRNTGCCFCEEAIRDVTHNYIELLKLNTIPVIVHQEKPLIFTRYLDKISDGNPIITNMIRVYDHNDFVRDALEVSGRFPNVIHHPKMFYRAFQLIFVKGYDNSFTGKGEGTGIGRKPAIFFIEKDKVVLEYRHLTYAVRPDYLRILVDPERRGIASDASSTVDTDRSFEPEIYCETLEKKEVEKPLQSTSQNKLNDVQPSAGPMCLCVPNTRAVGACGLNFKKPKLPKECEIFDSDDDLIRVLNNEVCQRYFQLFASKEHSSENVMFYEAVQTKYNRKFTENSKRKGAQEIIVTFFDEKSLLGINASKASKDLIIARLKDEGTPEDLFTDIIKEFKNGVLLDMYTRFQNSKLFEEMTIKYKEHFGTEFERPNCDDIVL
ncbi:hypothetical protein AKO1_005337 [Acrasis kona]|uniref:RGS domain-containing protein n=1 Tax=Acrasis kona TaxID=1008807 RepID=A0AAW2YMH0_9EUKA